MQNILVSLALGALGLLFSPFAAVQIQEWVFRYRAERLLVEVRSLIIRKATASEVEAVFKRWNPNTIPGVRGCCAIDLVLGRPVWDWSPDSGEGTLASIWSYLFFLGRGRDASLHVNAEFKGRTTTQILYLIRADTSGPVRDNRGSTGYLQAAIVLDSHLSLGSLWEGLAIHPNYLVRDQGLPDQGDAPFGEASAEFAPDANPADIERLARIDLSCLTRLSQCRNTADLMPAAVAQYASEKPQFARMRNEHACSPAVIELFSRDAQYAGVVDITGIREAPEAKYGGYRADLRMVQNLIPDSDWKEGKTRSVDVLDLFGDEKGKGRAASPPNEARIGSRFIILIPQLWGDPELNTDPCGVVPLNPANLDFVRHAIAGKLPPAKP